MDFEDTISFIDKTAISVVPPPISNTMLPVAFDISIPAPIAATLGSSSIYTFLAPVLSAASLIAFFSTGVIFVGQHINILGLVITFLALAFFMNSFNIISVNSKSAITPSFIGFIAFIFSGVLPNISLASSPTAITFFVSVSMTTMLGSFSTIPLPLIKINTFAVPKSIPISLASICLIPPIHYFTIIIIKYMFFSKKKKDLYNFYRTI